MKRTNKILAAALTLTLAFGITGCADNESKDSNTDTAAKTTDTEGETATAEGFRTLDEIKESG